MDSDISQCIKLKQYVAEKDLNQPAQAVSILMNTSSCVMIFYSDPTLKEERKCPNDFLFKLARIDLY